MNEQTIIDHLDVESLDYKLLLDLHERLTGKSGVERDIVLNDLLELFFLSKDSGGVIRPMLVTLLFAHPEPALIFPQFTVEFGVFDDSVNKVRPAISKSFKTNLPETFARLESFLRKEMRMSYKVVGFKRYDIYEYPLDVVREALINAFVHRDYGANSKVYVEFFRNEYIRIHNPGKLPQGITLKSLKGKNYNAIPRNPKIAQAMSLYVAAEGKGEGVRVMLDGMKSNQLNDPQFAEDAIGFEVILTGPGENFDKSNYTLPETGFEVPVSVTRHLNERASELTKMLLEDPNLRITNQFVRDRFNVVSDTAHRDINELLEKKIVVRHGSGRSTYYLFNNKFKSQ